MNRRSFLIVGATFAAGCSLMPTGVVGAAVSKERVVNAGPASQYLADGVYARFRDAGFFIVRRGAELFALSSICTHRRCKLDAAKSRKGRRGGICRCLKSPRTKTANCW
jgi:hypothetical protein